MSQVPARASRLARATGLLPVFAALTLNALAHDRWLLCVPAACVLAVMVVLGRQPAYSPRLLLVSAVVGGVAGVVMSGLWPVVAPIPPLVMGPLCGALVGLATISGVFGRLNYAITYSLLLAALSAAVRGSGAVYAGLGAVAASLLVVAFFQGGLGRAGLVGWLGFGVFALAVLGIDVGVWRFVVASEGVLTDTLFRVMSDAPRLSGVALQSEISLERQGRMPATGKLLMVLRGDRPERLRTAVFDTFDGTQWKTAPATEEARLTLTPPQPGEALRSTELTLLQTLRPYLPAPAGTRAVAGVSPTVLGAWMLRATSKEGTTVTLSHEPREELPTEPPPGDSLTALPDALRAELRPMALELTRNATTPRARAEMLEQWFRDNYEYSLTADLRGEGSPLAVLIRERRPAWCTYFASAMAALLRSLDVPARLAGGFVPQEQNSFSEAFLIRERDAHAWVEVYLPEEGRFVAFDPTPWRSREALQAEDKPGTLGAAWQAFSSVVGRWTSRVVSAPMEALTAVATFPLTWLVVAAAVAWRVLARSRRERRLRPREAMLGADPTLAAVYAKYLRAMKRGAGLIPGPTETDEELLTRLRAIKGAHAGALAEQFLTLYRQARYGGATSSSASLGTLAAELERQLHQEQ
jgi:transglutaminase-like putative cysteine protease